MNCGLLIIGLVGIDKTVFDWMEHIVHGRVDARALNWTNHV